jgi:hypothetical protein
MQAVLWIIVCTALAVILHRRPFILALAVITIWCLLPGIASPAVTGRDSGLLAIHPAATLAVIVVLVQLLLQTSWMSAALLHRLEWTVLLGVVCASSAVLGILAGRGQDAIRNAVDQVIGPVCLFFLFGACLLQRPPRVEALRAWFLAMALFQSGLAFVQSFSQSTILYADQFDDQYWFTDTFLRWMGTLDHPLVLSLMLVMAIPLSAGAGRGLLVVGLPCVYLGALLVTQSRAGVALGAVGLIYVLVVAPISARWRIVSAAVAGVAALGAIRMGLAAGLLERVADDTGSAEARAIARAYALDYLRENWWIGEGLNSSFAVSESAGLDTSFENALIMYSIDLGLVVALLYFLVMVLVAARAFNRRSPVGLAGAVLAALIAPQAFSALSGSTAAPAMVWTVLAMAGFHALAQKAPRRPVTHPLVASSYRPPRAPAW